MGDLITDWFTYVSSTQDDRSPEIYRKWCGIAMLAGAMERRVWVRTGESTTFCNLYTLLVGTSGAGKGIINTVREFWDEAKEPVTNTQSFKIAADSMTKSALVDALARAKQQKLRPDGGMEIYHSLLVAAEEFSVLLPAYDMEYIGTLNAIWNNKASHKEERRFGVKEVIIERPVLNILGGVQPSFLANVFPDEVWTTGLARRIIMVYSSEKRIVDPFRSISVPRDLRQSIIDRLGAVSILHGEIGWTPQAENYFREWTLSGEPPVPEHSRLIGYVVQRNHNARKLAGIASVSRKGDLSGIELIDIERVLEWMFEVEIYMPDIFRAMMAKSDHYIVEELYLFAMTIWHKGGQKPISSDKIFQFIAERTTSEKVEKILNLAIRTRAIKCVDQVHNLWIPVAKHLRSVE